MHRSCSAHRALRELAAGGLITVDGSPKSPYRRYAINNAGLEALGHSEEPARTVDLPAWGSSITTTLGDDTNNTNTPTEC